MIYVLVFCGGFCCGVSFLAVMLNKFEKDDWVE